MSAMATLEDEIKDLKEKNNELAQKVQYWKVTAAEKENEKLNLMKEMNELRLKLSRLRNTSGSKERQLDISIQQAGEKAISYLVEASSEIAKSIEIAKAYIRDCQEQDAESPRWSTLGGTPTTERTDRVHRVPPMMMGGQPIQPVVALSRTMLNTSNPRTGARSPSQNRSTTERAVPMHMLQDVYIPLTRIDASDLPNNNVETEVDAGSESGSSIVLGDEEEKLHLSEDETPHMSEEEDEFSSHKLEALSEEDSDNEELEAPRMNYRTNRDNPLEGPSWLLDSPQNASSTNQRNRTNLEPDSTTEPDRSPNTSTQKIVEETIQTDGNKSLSVRVSCEFSPTVRRRKRTSSPPLITPTQRKISTCGRVLKVVVSKMRMNSDGETPPKRARSPHEAYLTFDAPSPNGATDSAVIVSEARTLLLDKEIKTEPSASVGRRDSHDAMLCINSSQHCRQCRLSQDSHEVRNSEIEGCRRTKDMTNKKASSSNDSNVRGRLLSERESAQRSRRESQESRESDSGSGGGGDSITEGRTRRPRKMVVYKEKPLNRKLRR